MDPNLSTFVLPARELRFVERSLESLIRESGAGCAMLLEHSGQLVACRGDIEATTAEALGALLAGTFASTREVARLLKQEEFRLLLQQGVRENILTGTVGERWIVAVMFDERPRTGLVKVMVERVAQELDEVLRRVASGDGAEDGNIDERFKLAAEDAIDRLFSERE